MTGNPNSRDKTGSALDPSIDEIRRWGTAAVETMARYLDSIRDRRLYPQTTSQKIREKLSLTLPQEGRGIEQLLDTFDQVIVPMSRQNGHPRMFGYVQAPGTAIAALADLLASTLNANLTAWRSAPAAVEVERLTIDWIKQILGVPAGAAGLFVSGGSMANLAALAAARQAKGPDDLASKGAQSFPKAMRVYLSTQTHHSIEKAAGLLGIGRDNVRLIEVDERFKIRIDDLVAKISEDLEAGHLPFCVVANAGTVNTGAFDPLAEVSEVAKRFNLWMHVDASYGGFAVLGQSTRELFKDLPNADSVALDPHKWLYLPVDCGCVLYRDPETARATFAHDAEYTRVLEQAPDEAFAFWDYGPELSRRFRALKVWMTLECVGVRRFAEMIEKDLACARHLEQLVQASDDFEMLAPVELSIFCFRYTGRKNKAALVSANEAERKRIDSELDAFNERLLVALQQDGSSYLSNANLNGRFCLRGCVLNYRTTLHDMEILLDDLRRLAGGPGMRLASLYQNPLLADMTPIGHGPQGRGYNTVARSSASTIVPVRYHQTSMKLTKHILIAILSTIGLSAYGADTYKVDPTHSSVIFSIKHMGVSDFYGAFKQISGTVSLDAADPAKSTVEVTIPVDSVDTRNEKRDQHLKSPDFFNAAQFPTITFKSTKVEANGGNYKVTGDLTLHGVTKPLTVEFKKGGESKGQKGEVKTGGETHFTIKRGDFDMKFMNGPLGDDVNIILSLEGAKE